MTAIQTIASDARQRVDRIKITVEGAWQLIVESYQARDWEALGYGTWDEMCTREFGTSRLRLPREERQDVVSSLREQGLSLRAISAATGVAVNTIRNDAAKVYQIDTPADVVDWETEAENFPIDADTGEILDDEPEGFADKIAADLEAADAGLPAPVEPPKVTGIDGKQYAPTGRKAPRKALIDVAKARGFALRQAMESIERTFSDDRYRTNEKQVADALRGHLLYVAETVAAVLDQLP